MDDLTIALVSHRDRLHRIGEVLALSLIHI